MLRRLQAGAKRSLGQHFLANPGVARRIVSLAGVEQGSRVLEIGPGLGALTRELCAAGAELVALERDARLADWVAELAPEVRLVRGDALKLSLPELLPGSDWLCVSNLPYNIGTLLVGRMVRQPGTFRRLVVMLQREVAERICAPVGVKAYGALSVEIQARAEARLGFRVRPGSFHPPPRVESAVVVLDLRPEPDLAGAPQQRFDQVVRSAFAQRRKTLLNALGAAYGRPTAARILAKAKVEPGQRAERLERGDFARLALALEAEG